MTSSNREHGRVPDHVRLGGVRAVESCDDGIRSMIAFGPRSGLKVPSSGSGALSAALILPLIRGTTRACHEVEGGRRPGSEHSYRIGGPGSIGKTAENPHSAMGKRPISRIKKPIANSVRRKTKGSERGRKSKVQDSGQVPGSRKKAGHGPARRDGTGCETGEGSIYAVGTSSLWVGTTQSFTSVPISCPKTTLIVYSPRSLSGPSMRTFSVSTGKPSDLSAAAI